MCSCSRIYIGIIGLEAHFSLLFFFFLLVPSFVRRVERGEPGFRSMLQESGNSEEPSFEMDLAMYGSPSAILQSALENRSYVGNSYGLNSSTHELLPPLMTRTSPPHLGHLHFANNAPFWNASMKGNNGQPSFVPSSSSRCHQHFPIDEKPKVINQTQ